MTNKFGEIGQVLAEQDKFFWGNKNGKRYLRQAESSAIRFLIIAEAFKRMAASHVHTRLPVLYPEG
jgi:hypothetical protein